MVRACNSHAPTGGDMLRGLAGKKGFECYLTSQVSSKPESDWSFWSLVT